MVVVWVLDLQKPGLGIFLETEREREWAIDRSRFAPRGAALRATAAHAAEIDGLLHSFARVLRAEDRYCVSVLACKGVD